MMKLKIDSAASGKASLEVLFFVKKSVQFSPVLSGKASAEAEKVLEKIESEIYGDLEVVEIENRKLIFVNAAKERGLSSLDHLRTAAYRLAKYTRKRHIECVNLFLADASAEQVKSVFHGLAYAGYSFDRYKSKPKKAFAVTFEITAMERVKEFKKIAAEVETEQASITLAKDLINTPGSDLPPAGMALEAGKVAKECNLKIKIRDRKALEKEGFNGLVTVGKGSKNEPRLVTLEYRPAKAVKGIHLGIVGKGITFDTGGLCLKPQNGMSEMISDMSGSAATLAAIRAIALLKLPVQVTAVLALAENAIGAGAVLPGDIFKAKNGKTVMVDNTDAEGRLILTDGLAEAASYKVTHLIDLATLTGAMVRALGYAVTGFFSNDEKLAEAVIESGKASCEKFWQMPLEEEYADGLKTPFADMKNIGNEAGAISAALFLKEFVPENVKWSHWDIAGTAFVTKEWKYTAFGATGIGVQTLIELVRHLGNSHGK